MFPCFFCNNSKNFTVMRLVMFCFLNSVMALFVTSDWLIVRETPIGLLSKLIYQFSFTKQPRTLDNLFCEIPYVCLSVWPEFFSFLEFSDFLYEGSTSSNLKSDGVRFLKKFSFWGLWVNRAQSEVSQILWKVNTWIILIFAWKECSGQYSVLI